MIALFLFTPVLILPGMLLLARLERTAGRVGPIPGRQPRYEDYEDFDEQAPPVPR